MPKRIGKKILAVLNIGENDRLVERVMTASRSKPIDHSVAALVGAQYVRTKATLQLRRRGFKAIGKRLHLRSFVAKRSDEDLKAVVEQVLQQNTSSADGMKIVFDRKRGDFVLVEVELENIFIVSLLPN